MSETLLSLPSSGTPGATDAQPYTFYQYSFVATLSETWLTFEFEQDPSYWNLDDVSFTSGSTQLLINGGFETGDLTGWTTIGEQGLTASAAVESDSPHSGTYELDDGAVGGIDGLYQAVATTIGQTYTIGFWLANDEATSGAPDDLGLALVQVGTNVLGSAVLTISGAPASQTILNSGTIAAFSGVTLADGNAGPQTETLTVSSGTLNGSFSDSAGGTISNGVFTDTGSIATVQADLQALVFTPAAGQTAPAVSTNVTITLGDTAGASTTDTATVTAVTQPLAIAGTASGQTLLDTGTIAPFAAVALSDDLTAPQTETLTVTSASLNGTLSDSAGGTITDGTYTVSGDIATVQADVQALVFTPTPNQVAPGDTISTGFTLALSDGSGASTTDTSTSVTVTAANVTPSFGGGTTVQSVALDGTITPFTGVTISDAAYSASETLTILLTDGGVATDADGTLSGTGLTETSPGTYTLAAGTPAAVTAALQALQFTSSVALNGTATTLFTLSLSDNHGTSATDTITTVNASNVGAPSGLTLAPGSDSGVAGDHITNVITPTILGIGIAGDTVTLYDGANAVGTGIVALDGSWSIVTSSLASGSQTLTATQTDPDADVSAHSSGLTLTIDTTLPAAPSGLTLDRGSDSGVVGDDITDHTTPRIDGLGAAGDRITLYDGNTDIGTATVGLHGLWSITTSPLALGANTLTAIETDIAGNASLRSSVLRLDIDIPAAPRALALAAGSDSGVPGDDITNDTTPTITGTGIAGDTVVLRDDASGGDTAIGTATVGSNGTWSITTSALHNGLQVLTANQTDEAGSASTSSSALTLTIDIAAPAAPAALTLAAGSDTGVVGDGITSDTTPTIIGTGVAGDTVTLFDNGSAVGTATVAGDGTWAVVSTGPLADGNNSFTATQTDVAGNVSAPSVPLLVTIDTEIPAAPTALALAPGSDSGVPGDDITNDTTPAVSGTGIAGDVVTLRDGQSIVGTAVVAGDGVWSITTAALASGAHSLTATQTDVAGNVSGASGTLLVTIDTTSPAAPQSLYLNAGSDSGIPGDDITDVTTPVISGAAAAGDTVTLYDGTRSVGTATVGANGVWSVETSDLANGVHTLTAKVTDVAGNVSVASSPLAITILPVPGVPTLADPSARTTPGEPVVSGTAPANSLVSVYKGSSLVGTATASASGDWMYMFGTALPQGTYALTATATDAAGDVSAASAPVTVTVSAAGGYTFFGAANAAGDVVARVHDSTGALVEVDTRNATGLLLESVSNTQALLNIYDSSGRLIGTITQPSTAATSQPVFLTSGQTLSATTGSGPVGSVIDLLSESNVIRSQGNDTVNAGPGSDTIFAGGATCAVYGGSGTLFMIGGSGRMTVFGGTGSSTVFGGAGGSQIYGGSAGHNILVAGGGDNTVLGGGGGDTLVGGAGTALLAMVEGGVAFGGTGTSTLFGASGGIMVAGSGDDTLVGAAGNEALWGGAGNATLFGGTGADTLGSGTGTTTLVAGSGPTTFVDGGGHSAMWGGVGDTTVFGGTGNALVNLGAGASEVVFGSGTMSVHGGAGTDLYDVTRGLSDGGTDQISGFKPGTDQIDLFGYARQDLTQTVSADNTILSFDDGTTITLMGVTSLSPGSIVFG